MAKLNMIIRAFDPEELQMLNEIMNNRDDQALEEGFILPEPFHQLKDKIHLASKYANGLNREHIV